MASADGPEIREVIESDVPFFYEFQSDPESAAMATFTPKDLDAVKRRWRAIMADDQITARTIVVAGEVAGCVMAWTADEGHREVGYWLGRQFWGRGVATASLAEFVAIDPHRPMWARVSPPNLGSARVLEKNGFGYEGEADGYRVFTLRGPMPQAFPARAGYDGIPSPS